MSRRRLIPLALGILLIASCRTQSDPSRDGTRLTSPDAPAYRLIGYVGGRTDIWRIDPRKLTHVNYAFAQVNDDGEIYFRNDRSPAHIAQLQALKARNPNLKILVSVGGWGADGFSDAALTEASREVFSHSAVEMIEDHGLDGIDIDWEFPGQPGPGIKYRPEDKQNFTLMLASQDVTRICSSYPSPNARTCLMTDRRSFLKLSTMGSLAAGHLAFAASVPARKGPVVISTWNHGIAANEAAWAILSEGGRALDAVEAGVRVTEADPEGHTVGIGGYPDQEGNVTLDACIMNEHGDAGSVAYLQHIMHPISVARKVMEETPHVMLVGEGALDFALKQGFEKVDLLTPEAEAEWQKWKASNDPDTRQEINVENHDTIGQLALDAHGNLSGACTTSGAAWKMPGRVGDSPIIGAGLFVDNEVGAACATGWGEAVIRVVGSHLVVELMRQGKDPMTACRMAVDRIISKNPDYREIQVGFLALDRQGRFGAYAIQPGFEAAVYNSEGNRLLPATSLL